MEAELQSLRAERVKLQERVTQVHDQLYDIVTESHKENIHHEKHHHVSLVLLPADSFAVR